MYYSLRNRKDITRISLQNSGHPSKQKKQKKCGFYSKNVPILACCSFALYIAFSYLYLWSKVSSSSQLALQPFLESTFALTNNVSPPIISDNLTIFWINLDSATERCQTTQEQLDRLVKSGFDVVHERVHAIDEEEIFHLLANHSLGLNDIKLDFQWSCLATWRMHVWGIYLYNEAACLISHLSAILLAYQRGQEYALFMEDDVELQAQFLKEWRHQVSLAPMDWTCLQWVTNNKVIRERGIKMLDPWISWQPDHWSSSAYMLNRKGMQMVLSHALSTRSDGSKMWRVTVPQVLVADEVIFLLAGKSYTSTYPWWFDFSPAESSIGRISTNEGDIVRQSANHSQFNHSHFNENTMQSTESLLVLQSFLASSPTIIMEEIERLIVDASAVAAYHVICVWRVKAVITEERLRPILLSEIEHLPNFVEVFIAVSNARFNKFSFFSKFISDMPHFDRVLLKDNDIRIAGFPWISFLKSTKHAIIAAPIRQAVDESLIRNLFGQDIRPQRQWYRLHQGLNWKLGWRHTDIFQDYTPIQVPFLEEYFVLMDGSFASWFLKQVLIPDFIEQPSSWGPDKMWCGAAKEYDPSRPSCVLSPLIIRDDDTRQIYKNFLHRRLGNLALDRFRKVDKFKNWMATSDFWDIIIGGKSLNGIERACKVLTKSSSFDLQECAQLVSSGDASFTWDRLPQN